MRHVDQVYDREVSLLLCLTSCGGPSCPSIIFLPFLRLRLRLVTSLEAEASYLIASVLQDASPQAGNADRWQKRCHSSVEELEKA